VHCQNWMDERLSWNASETENVTYIYVHSDDMWVPDIVQINE